ncbi:class A beta-lactamase [Acetobacteraceae bacterium H6797]|nr:class A beta-lactamase [Acetobacteraceae bacterium H6797]
MIGKRPLLALAALSLATTRSRAYAADGFAALPARFARIEAERGGRLGVAVLDTATGRRALYRAEERFPFSSTYKLIAAAAVLSRVDAGREKLEREIPIQRESLVTYSPVTEKRAGGRMSLAEICEAAITLSDNTAGNILFDAMDGPEGLTAWMREQGDGVSRLDRRETALNEARPGDARDTTTPAAMLGHLERLTQGDALSAASRRSLIGWLQANRTGDARLKARLPAGWRAGEKTGTSAFSTSSDVGLLWPPDGAAPILVAAYLTEGSADGAIREAALADIGAAIAQAAG